MTEDSETLAALILGSDKFCAKIEAALGDFPPNAERDELRLKLGHSRNLLTDLQTLFNEDQLILKNPSVQTQFRILITNLLWVSFYARHHLDRKTFRLLVMVEYGFSFLLANRDQHLTD